VRGQIPFSLPADTAALLLLELDGSVAEVERQQTRLLKYLTREQIAHRQAKSEVEAQEIWQARRAISPATFTLKPHKISEDVVVPRAKIPELVSFTEELARELALTILTFGHAGDGNIHVNIMLDRSDKEEERRGEGARERLFAFVVGLGGTLSGEHGIGITKSRFLPLELSPTSLAVMRNIKNLFDPNHILNPGKIFPDPD